MADRDPVAALFAPLVPPGVTLVARAIAGDEPALHPDELAHVARVAPKRRRGFAFGRACAREALGRDVAIVIGAGGAPVWPAGVHGSITHTDDHAAAAVGPQPIGIDLESLAHAARTPDLLAMVARPSERTQPAALVFSAKEAVYKWLYPQDGVFRDFLDVELVFDAGTFTLVGEPRLTGRYAIDAEHVACVVTAAR